MGPGGPACVYEELHVEVFLCVVSEIKSGLPRIPKITEILLAPGLQFLELLFLQRTHTEANFSLMRYVVKQW